MFNIENLFNIEDEEKLIEPDRIFSSLVKNSEYEYLRDVQTEILNNWFERRNEKDIILKMNTGSGKTFVGLLMLQSSLNEGEGPAVYVCPNLQLVDQVIERAKDYGIKCTTFSEKDNNKIPVEFLNGESILVTVFDKIFNGRSIFSKNDIEIGTILLDDAHSCISKAREKFTIKINNDSYLYSEISKLFQKSLHQQDLGSCQSIYNGNHSTIMQIPYWTWLENVNFIAEKFSAIAQRFKGNYKIKDSAIKNIVFNWPLIQKNIEQCHVFISGSSIEITPHCLPIEQFDCFENANRRIFMSATLLDDSLLVKELNIDINAIKNPLLSNKYYNIGERMILIPSLIHESLNTLKIPKICKELKQNTIVLTPSSSESYITKWVNEEAKILKSDNICTEIRNLEKNIENYLVLPNRYDGIDLHGDKCRILVIEGLPLGATLYERFLKVARPSSKILKTLLAQKIEQGIGRSTRSSSDYSVVILTGRDLETFISMNENKKYLSPQTRKQIEVGVQFIKKLPTIDETNAIGTLKQIMNAVFSRNSNWIKFHNTELQKSKQEIIEKLPIELAIVERKAYQLANSNRSSEACQTITTAINKLNDKLDSSDKGWYLQLAASYLYKVDKSAAFEKQIKAHEFNSNLCKTIDGIKYKKLDKINNIQTNKILNNIKNFSHSNAIILHANSFLEHLDFGKNSDSFEKAFKELGNFLGYNCQRPEKEFENGLPDILWQMTNGKFIIVEAKNEVKLDREKIYKAEAEQITNGYNWFETEYIGKEGYPILIHPTNNKDTCAYPHHKVRVMRKKELDKLTKNVLSFAKFIAENFNKTINEILINEELIKLNLLPENFIKNYTVEIV